MMARRCRAVIFDLDGTLIETESVYRAAFMAAARDFGFVVSETLYAALLGVASSERAPILRTAFGADFPAAAFLDAYYRHRAARLPARIPVRRGTVSLLRGLDVPKAVATSASRRTAHEHLRRAGLASHFRHVATRDDVTCGKPAPDIFLHAAALLGSAPEACLAVEDSPNGIAAARQAGMQVLAVAPEQDFASLLAVFEAAFGPRSSAQEVFASADC